MPANTADTDNLVIALGPYHEGRAYASRAGLFLSLRLFAVWGKELAIAAIRHCNSDLRALLRLVECTIAEWPGQMIPDYDIIGPQSPGARVPHRRIYFDALARFASRLRYDDSAPLWVIGRHQLVSDQPC